jgi:hypothetical protein
MVGSMAKLIFDKQPKTVFEKLICWWTKSPYCHVEIWNDGYSYTASAKDNGVRKYYKPFINPEIWDTVEVDVPKGEIERLYEETKDHTYDWKGIVFKEIFNITLDSSSAWYCSEWCAEALGLEDRLVSPGDLYNNITGK